MPYYVYILTNTPPTTLYVGSTNDLERRVWEHKKKLVLGFTAKYNLNVLVYFEETGMAQDAMDRERQLKGWSRSKKAALVETLNPQWRDLSEGWYSEGS